MTITEFLEARIAEAEAVATALLKDLEGEVAESYADAIDDRGPFTPQRLLSAKMWAQFAGQSKWRNFATGQNIATLANPSRVLAECVAKRAILEGHEPVKDKGWIDGAPHDYLWCGSCGSLDDSPVPAPCPTLQALAAVYADHPDYQQEWAA